MDNYQNIVSYFNAYGYAKTQRRFHLTFFQLINIIEAQKGNKMFTVATSWDKETIKFDKEIGRNDGIYPDTVFWGISINGLCNPSLKSFLDELAKYINSHPIPDEPEQPRCGLLGRIGQLLINWDVRLANH